MLEFFFKIILFYLFFLVVVHFQKEREVSKLSCFELGNFLILNAFAFYTCFQSGRTFYPFALITVILWIFQQVLQRIFDKDQKMKKLFGKKPTLLIQNGKLNFKELTKMNFSLDYLFVKLKEEGISSIEDVQYAVLETDGSLALFQKEGTVYPYPLILDGIINTDGLREIGKDMKWLHKILKGKGVALDEVFYAFWMNQHAFVIKKQECLTK